MSDNIDGPCFGNGFPLESSTLFQFNTRKMNVRIVSRSGYVNGVWKGRVHENVTHLIYAQHMREVAAFLIESAERVEAERAKVQP